MSIRIYVAASLDGFIADRDGKVDWLLPFQDQDYGYESFLGTIGTVVMGRASYETALSLGPWPYANQRSLVLSSRSIRGLPANTSIVRSVKDALAKIRESGGDAWIMGGSQVMGAFLDVEAIDEMQIYVIPVLLGSGTPLFQRTGGPQALEASDIERYPNGVIKLEYRRASARV